MSNLQNKDEERVIIDVLEDIEKQLKIMNMYLMIMSDCEINKTEIE
jgi:hypothetical protein